MIDSLKQMGLRAEIIRWVQAHVNDTIRATVKDLTEECEPITVVSKPNLVGSVVNFVNGTDRLGVPLLKIEDLESDATSISFKTQTHILNTLEVL